ncbi:MAG: DUF308 domain-containing protein [Clostridia bacterium]|nr:DUF308 domain-containing protein [Clostridia bacterium]
MANKKSLKASGVLASLLYIVIGALLLIFPGDALNWAMTIAGIVFVVFGALELLKKNWVGGVVSLVIGIVILVLGWTIAWIVLLVLGIMIAVKGAIALIDVLKSKEKGLLRILFPCLTIICGLFLAFGNAAEVVVMIGAILIILDGVFGLIASLKK